VIKSLAPCFNALASLSRLGIPLAGWEKSLPPSLYPSLPRTGFGRDLGAKIPNPPGIGRDDPVPFRILILDDINLII